MNTINLTGPIPVQLCEEDRHRLDTIIEALAAILEQGRVAGTPFGAIQEPAEAQNEAPDTEPVPDRKATEVKLAGIQKKVVDLSTAGKKDAVKEVIQSFAAKVSAIPEDKFGEVWAKLIALEG